MKMKSKTTRNIIRYAFWLFFLAIMVFVFWNSAQTADQSNETSVSFTEKVLTLIWPSFTEKVEAEKQSILASLQFFVRKSAHFSVYCALGVSCASALSTYRFKTKNKAISAVLICLVYAISDEVHQLFVPGRAGRITDVMIDLSGSVLGVMLVLGIVSVYRKSQLKKKNKGEYPVKKRELVEKLSQLIDSMNHLQQQLSLLQKENDELRAELEELRSKPVKIETAEEVPMSASIETKTQTETEPKGFTVKEIDTAELEEPQLIQCKSISEPVQEAQPQTEYKKEEAACKPPINTEPVVLSDENMEYGSIAIGTIVQESIKYANIISSSDSSSKKELLNLIMGKGEVAKAEIFSIVESDSSADVKRELMDSQVSEAVDYFKSVAGQI